MSTLKEKVKELIKKQLPDNLGNTKYRIGIVNFLNDTAVFDPSQKRGTCQVSIDGTNVEAFPLYPVTIGQEVMVMMGVDGKNSAVPTRPAVPQIDIILPPFFTGGRLRFLSQTYDINNIFGFDNFVKIQDFGNSNLYLYDLGTSNILLNPIFSPNGQYIVFAQAVTGNKYQVKSVRIGSNLTALDKPLNKDLKIFTLKATDKVSIQSVNNIIFTDPGFSSDGILRTDFTLLDIAVDNSGNIYWLESQVDIWSITFGLPPNTVQVPAISTVFSGVTRMFKFDGTDKTTIAEYTTFSTVVNRTITTPGAGVTQSQVTINYVSKSGVPLLIAEPLQGLTFVGADDSGGTSIFNAVSTNSNSTATLPGPPFSRGFAAGTESVGPPFIYSYTARATPAIADKTGSIIAIGKGVLGSSSTGNHNPPRPVGFDILNAGVNTATPRYQISIISNFHIASTTGSPKQSLWWVDDISLKMFGFQLTKKNDKPLITQFSVSNSLTDLNMDLLISSSDFRQFLSQFFKFNFLLMDKYWIEFGGIEATHSFNPETHRHVRTLKLDPDTLVATVVPDGKHLNGVSPNDPGGYPNENIPAPNVSPDFGQYRLLFNPRAPNFLPEFLYSVCLVT